jgi:hypothetical protein
LLVLIRKIDVLLWSPERCGCSQGEVPATLIQDKRELSAPGCALSFWLLNTDDSNWEDDAFLALLGAPKNDRVDAMRIAFVDVSTVTGAGVRVETTAGETRFQPLAHRHRDAVKLDGQRLVAIAQLMAGAISQGQVRFRTREELVQTLVRGVRDRGLAKAAQLPKDMKDALAAQGVS